MDLKGKKLLILGGTALSKEIIKQAQSRGAYVIVTDYLEDSPGKKIADESFMISTTDVNEVVNLIKNENIDGILTGFIDSMLPYYQEICDKTGLPCYITKEQIEITTNKVKFKELCKKHNIPVVEEYQVSYPFLDSEIEKLEFPVLIKPVDNSGARGIYICNNVNELKEKYKESLSFSPSKQVIVERYMTSKEVTIFYVIQDGEISLTAMADRYTKNRQGGIIPLPVGYVFPSNFINKYQESLDSKVMEMFKGIGVKNGMIFIQSFVEDGQCIFYEMGYRLTGSLEYKITSKINDNNPLDMMIGFALTGSMNPKKDSVKINPNFNVWGCNLTFLVKPGEIGKISGINEVSLIQEVLDVVTLYEEGDIIPNSAIGTLRQAAIKVFAIGDSKKNLLKVIEEISKAINVQSKTGENMLLDPLYTNEIL